MEYAAIKLSQQIIFLIIETRGPKSTSEIETVQKLNLSHKRSIQSVTHSILITQVIPKVLQ